MPMHDEPEHHLRHSEERAENIGPNASHQVLLADQLSVAFKQSNQDFQSATSERHGLVAFRQKELRSKQANGLNETSVGVAPAGSVRFSKNGLADPDANGASDVELRFELK